MLSWFSSRAFTPLNEEEIKKNLSGKEFLVIGGTKGIGASIVKHLIKMGDGKVTLIGRHLNDQEIQEMKNATFISADLSTMSECRNLVKNKLKGKTFDTVFFTAGIISKYDLHKTVEGIEEDLAVSYLSRFVILQELIQANAIVGRRRVYNWGFPGDYKSAPYNLNDLCFEKDDTEYKQFQVHFTTVLFNDAFVYEANRRYPGLHMYSMRPGLIQTGIRDNVHGGKSTYGGWLIESLVDLLFMSTDTYVHDVIIHLVASDEIKAPCAISQNGQQQPPLGWLADEDHRVQLWEISEKLVEKADSNKNKGKP